MKGQNALEAAESKITMLWVFVCIISLVAIGNWYGWRSAPSKIDVHISPQIRDSGGIAHPGEFYPALVYDFALMTLQDIYRWPEDGQSDYGMKIADNQDRLTSRYREYLIRNMQFKSKKGELDERTRIAEPLPGAERYEEGLVETLDNDDWLVYLNLEIIERQAGIQVKRTPVLYPIHVVRLDANSERNPWNIALDGFPTGQRSKTLTSEEVETLAAAE